MSNESREIIFLSSGELGSTVRVRTWSPLLKFVYRQSTHSFLLVSTWVEVQTWHFFFHLWWLRLFHSQKILGRKYEYHQWKNVVGLWNTEMDPLWRVAHFSSFDISLIRSSPWTRSHSGYENLCQSIFQQSPLDLIDFKVIYGNFERSFLGSNAPLHG